MTLSALFSACISVSYMEIGNTVNYAIKRDGNILYIFFEDSQDVNIIVKITHINNKYFFI